MPDGHITNFREFIREKTPEKLEEDLAALRIDRGAIYVWTTRNAIPRKFWPDLLIAYPQLGLSDLMVWEKAKDDK